jgi:hypothetical protein
MYLLRNKIPSALAALTLAALAALALPAPMANAAELLAIESARCPYCLAWEHEIGHSYANTEEGRRAPLRRLKIEAGRPADLKNLEIVHTTPTFILMEDGQEVGRVVGYAGERSFWPALRRLLAKLPPKQ